jgi:acylpyruvate hydrolase
VRLVTVAINGETIRHYLSQIMTLESGDLIATGTPGGVGFARNPQVFLKPGDEVQVEMFTIPMVTCLWQKPAVA